jgi:hypothetical protein
MDNPHAIASADAHLVGLLVQSSDVAHCVARSMPDKSSPTGVDLDGVVVRKGLLHPPDDCEGAASMELRRLFRDAANGYTPSGADSEFFVSTTPAAPTAMSALRFVRTTVRACGRPAYSNRPTSNHAAVRRRGRGLLQPRTCDVTGCGERLA